MLKLGSKEHSYVEALTLGQFEKKAMIVGPWGPRRLLFDVPEKKGNVWQTHNYQGNEAWKGFAFSHWTNEGESAGKLCLTVE